MHRRIIFFLLATAPGLFGAGGIERGLFNGSWSVTNRHNVRISGPLSIVFPENGRPAVHFYAPVQTNETIEFIPVIKPAARPTRRSIAWTVPGFGRLHGGQRVDGVTETISGTLRLRGEGRGTFTAERFLCSGDGIPFLLPEQLSLVVFHSGCLGTPLTNGVVITNLPPRPPRPPIVVLPPLPPTPATNSLETNITIFPPLIFLSNAPPLIRITNALPAFPPEVTDPAELNARIDMLLRSVKRSSLILTPSPQFRMK